MFQLGVLYYLNFVLNEMYQKYVGIELGNVMEKSYSLKIMILKNKGNQLKNVSSGDKGDGVRGVIWKQKEVKG